MLETIVPLNTVEYILLPVLSRAEKRHLLRCELVLILVYKLHDKVGLKSTEVTARKDIALAT